MSVDAVKHPSEDDLTAFALEGGDSAMQAHVDGCEQCSLFVADMAKLANSLSSLDAEDVPLRLGRSLTGRRHDSTGTRFLDTLAGLLLKNPAVLPLIYLLYIVLAYFIFSYLNDLALLP